MTEPELIRQGWDRWCEVTGMGDAIPRLGETDADCVRRTGLPVYRQAMDDYLMPDGTARAYEIVQDCGWYDVPSTHPHRS